MARRINVCSDIDETIPEFYSGRNVFITGFTGFVGKALVEKLLRSCPNIGTIYVLMRKKPGKSIPERLDKILGNVLYDTLKAVNKDALKKIVPIEGNLVELGLGLSHENRTTLINKVSIVFHIAATVRFDLTLRDAIFQNTRGTRDVCRLVNEMKNLKVFVHVSTGYCQTFEPEVYERTYSSSVDWKQAIEVAENIDEQHLKVLTAKYIEGFPNTYTFSKSLAESVVTDMCLGKIPVVIVRPTIVTLMVADPIPGWVDNLNGPVGVMVAYKKGILRATLCREIKLDFIAVDELVRTLIKTSWLQSYVKSDEINVYNISCNNLYDFTIQRIAEVGADVANEAVMDQVWHYSAFSTHSTALYYLRFYLFQVLPSFLADTILVLLKKKPIAMKIQRKIQHHHDQFHHFTHHEWTFYNDKYLELDDHIVPSDKYDFGMVCKDFDMKKSWIEAGEMVAKLILKEDISDVKRLKTKQFRLQWIHFIIKYTTYTAAIISTYNCIGVPLLNCALDYLDGL